MSKRVIVFGTATEQALVRTIEELKRENAALRADIQAHEQINRQLIEDKRRLDFLGQAKSAYYYEGPCCWRINEDKDTDGDTLRAAIDAARKKNQP